MVTQYDMSTFEVLYSDSSSETGSVIGATTIAPEQLLDARLQSVEEAKTLEKPKGMPLDLMGVPSGDFLRRMK